jgi:hypothetical protein
MGEDAFDRWYAAVDGDDRDAGLDGLLKCGSHGVDLIRADHDAFDALGYRRLDVGRLFGRGDLAVGLDSLIALLLDLRLEGVHHMHEEGKAQARHRRQDLVSSQGGR